VTAEQIQVDPALLLSVWNMGAGQSPHRRMGNLLASLFPALVLEQDTLGQRNRRLLQLHSGLFDRSIEARVACPECGTQNEFAIPRKDMLAAPIADADAVAVISAGGKTASFRQPRMADISIAAQDDDPKAALVRLCSIDGVTELSDREARALAAHYETLDPLSNIIISTPCVQCGATISATVELADFVTKDVERLADSLLRDIDCIASAYGWTEAEILALPADRRMRYVSMIAARRQPARRQLTGLSA
jgi:hypothetical protein